MEWVLDPATPTTASELRTAIRDYLVRHAADPEQVWGAELVVAELLGNAVEHASGPAWVTLEWAGQRPVLAVHDLGPRFELAPSLPPEEAEGGRGLWLVSQLAEDVRIAAKRAGGKLISAALPVDRLAEPSYDPPPRTVAPLPRLDDAGPHGFPREPFLRALVVELSLAVEDGHGPLAAQAAVARVGATVGGQMEEEYRRARGVVARLTREQIADCYVRLKAAIDGDFYLIEITDERIVLGNRRCPFGEVVRQSPALCRMTSSVFGGIAARNAGPAVVQLEERIALGDPECRVTVLLGAAAEQATTGHRYRAGAPPRQLSPTDS